ncbi:MAG: glycine cleavage system aminomethyltransferase GcvT [bacterium]
MKQTPLYETHKHLNAKFMEFGGYEMPLQYTGIIDEHLNVRNNVGIFDVSHMGEIFISGPDALDFCEWLTPNHVSRLAKGMAHYNFLLNEHGGVIDDLIIYRLDDDEFMFCVNASNTEKDYSWIMSHKKGNVVIENRSDDIGMISVQGPLAARTMESIFPGITDIKRFTFKIETFEGKQVIVSRTGYTGEDGFECFVDKDVVVNLWNDVMEAGKPYHIKPVGLGARDTLRAEMGYPLYGMELDEATTPIPANLGWVIKIDKGSFIGREALKTEISHGITKRLFGIVMDAKSIPRHKNPVLAKRNVVGEVTTGTYSPSLSRGIAMAYIDTDIEVNEVGVDIRGILHTGRVVQLPFVKK